jgi:hypothetical protein
MLRDRIPSNQSPLPNDLDVTPSVEVEKILAFVDETISDFCSFYQSNKDTDRENRISDFLVHHFQVCKNERFGGFFPFDFRKNPTQEHSEKETDIGVFVLTKGRKPISIIEFEAKRFSESSNNKEYVCGTRGGMERFKRGHHASHLLICGMFAYVQSRTSMEWLDKVNEWIEQLSKSNPDTTIDWSSSKEKLVNEKSFPKIEKLKSKNYRKQSNDTILLWHYFIDLY